MNSKKIFQQRESSKTSSELHQPGELSIKGEGEARDSGLKSDKSAKEEASEEDV